MRADLFSCNERLNGRSLCFNSAFLRCLLRLGVRRPDVVCARESPISSLRGEWVTQKRGESEMQAGVLVWQDSLNYVCSTVAPHSKVTILLQHSKRRKAGSKPPASDDCRKPWTFLLIAGLPARSNSTLALHAASCIVFHLQ